MLVGICGRCTQARRPWRHVAGSGFRAGRQDGMDRVMSRRFDVALAPFIYGSARRGGGWSDQPESMGRFGLRATGPSVAHPNRCVRAASPASPLEIACWWGRCSGKDHQHDRTIRVGCKTPRRHIPVEISGRLHQEATRKRYWSCYTLVEKGTGLLAGSYSASAHRFDKPKDAIYLTGNLLPAPCLHVSS